VSDGTLAWYEQHAAEYCERTLHADMSSPIARFLDGLKPDGLILDLGCGSGRDTRRFLDLGYRVDAWDGSPAIARHASASLGRAVSARTAQSLEEVEQYDGIWACSSLLHLSRTEFVDVARKIRSALRPSGRFYASLKCGADDAVVGGRYFCFWTAEQVVSTLQGQCGLVVLASWTSPDEHRSDTTWINVLCTV